MEDERHGMGTIFRRQSKFSNITKHRSSVMIDGCVYLRLSTRDNGSYSYTLSVVYSLITYT